MTLQQTGTQTAQSTINAATPPLTAHSPKRSKSTPNLRERKKAQARAVILTSAHELINQKGYCDTKMREIARAAEVSYQTLYNYFPTKALILQELLTRSMPESISHNLAEVPSSGGPLPTALALIQSYFDAITYWERDLWREVAIELIKGSAPKRCLLDVIDPGRQESLTRLFCESQRTGQITQSVDALLLASTTYKMMNCALVDFLSNSEMSRAAASQHLINQVRLLLAPYSQDLSEV